MIQLTQDEKRAKELRKTLAGLGYSSPKKVVKTPSKNLSFLDKYLAKNGYSLPKKEKTRPIKNLVFLSKYIDQDKAAKELQDNASVSARNAAREAQLAAKTAVELATLSTRLASKLEERTTSEVTSLAAKLEERMTVVEALASTSHLSSTSTKDTLVSIQNKIEEVLNKPSEVLPNTPTLSKDEIGALITDIVGQKETKEDLEITPELVKQIIKVMHSLPEMDKLEVSKGIRNAQSFIYGGTKYKMEEMMHGGGSAGISIITVTGTINDSNVTFTATSQPTLLNINGAFYNTTGGAITWSYSGGTITLSSAVGTGGSIFGIS